MTLRFRHPDLVSEMRDSIAALWRSHDVFTKEEYERARSADDPESFDGYIAQLAPDAAIRVQLDLLVASMDNEQIGKHIVGMTWAVLDVSSAAHRLLTSDWPVELIIGARPATVSLPLSPTLLFVASDDKSTLDGLARANPDNLVSTMNG
jgi:Protein of unknown function (DUF4238)